MKPQIATILDDGSYGQRDMTDDEIAEMQAQIAAARQVAQLPQIGEPPE